MRVAVQPDLQKAVTSTTNSFIEQICSIAKGAAEHALRDAFGRVGHQPKSKSWLADRRPGKRTATDLEQLKLRFRMFVRSQPGLRIEQINRELGTTTRDLALPIRQMLDIGTIHSQGKKRCTQYFDGAAPSKKHGSNKSSGVSP